MVSIASRPQCVKAWWHISRENGRQFRWCFVTCFVPSHYWLNWINQCFKLFWTRSGDYAWYPPQPPGSLVMWDSLTNSEDHFWIACVSYFLDPNMCGFQNICRVLWSQTLVVKWKNKVFILFHQSRSVSSPNPIGCAVTNSVKFIKWQPFCFTSTALESSTCSSVLQVICTVEPLYNTVHYRRY